MTVYRRLSVAGGSFHAILVLFSWFSKTLRKSATHHERQTQTEVDGLEDAVIPAADRLRIELLEAALEQVHALAFLRVLTHFFYTVTEDLTHGLALTWRFRCVLTHVLHDGPQVEHGPPVDVP